MSSNDLSHTIANMMEILNPSRSRRKSEFRTPIDFDNPLKRRLSNSDSFESPSKCPRSENSLDVSWIASPRETRRLRSELIDARTHVTNLEHRIQHMHGVQKEMQVMFNSEIDLLRSRHERDVKSIEQLEQQMQSIRKREREAKEELDEIKNKENTEKLQQDVQINELESKVRKLQSQLQEYESDENDEISQLKSQIFELEMVKNAAQQDAKAHKELAAELEVRLNKISSAERDNEIKDQNLQCAQLKIKDLEYKLEMYAEFKEQAKIQQHKLLTYRNLEKEIAKLREEKKSLADEVQNKLILEEQNYDLTKKIDTLQKQEKKYNALQVAHAQLQTMIDDWRTVAQGLCDTNGPESMMPRQVRQYIEKLQNQEITFTSEKMQLESAVKALQHEIVLYKSELKKYEKLSSNLQSTETFVHRLRKKLSLVSRERDSYRLQLDSYEKELTVNIPQGTQSAQQLQFNVQKERIESLTKLVEGYKEMMATMEKEPQSADMTGEMAPIRKEQLLRLADEVERLQAENTRLTDRCDELEVQLEQLLVGRDLGHKQVVHFKLNPSDEAHREREKTVEKLQEEVDRLKRKIRNMEEGIENSKMSETICSAEEVQLLHEKIKSLEKKMQYLKECFKSRSLEFRNSCYMLFGYKIERVRDNQYKLSSMYAEAPDDHLIFELTEDQNFNILKTDFSATLDELIDLHLRHQSSIPVFLSALTMDLFNRTTMNTKTFGE